MQETLDEYNELLQEIIDILYENEELHLPYEHNDNYSEKVERKIDAYINTIRRIKAIKEFETVNVDIELLCCIKKKILDSISLYLDGRSGKAFKEIEGVMNVLNSRNLLPKRKLSQYCYHGHITDESHNLFRARESEEILQERGEIFHIPFEKRQRVAAQRYSIPGVPFLYLSNSLLACWEELRRPDLNKLYISRFKVNKEHSDRLVLDFGNVIENLTRKG